MIFIYRHLQYNDIYSEHKSISTGKATIMNYRSIHIRKVFAVLCTVILVFGGCGKVRESETDRTEPVVTPTGSPEFKPENASDLAGKTAEKLENLKSVHMNLSADVSATLDIFGTIMSGLGNNGSGEGFVPDLDSILGNSVSSRDEGHRESTDPLMAVTFPKIRDVGISGKTAGAIMKTSGGSESNDAMFSMRLLYEADIQDDPAGMHFFGGADFSIMGNSGKVPVDAYYFEEGSEHALYTQEEGVWKRQTVEMEDVSPSMSSTFFRKIEDGTVNAGLSDINVEVNGHDTYRLNVTVSGENIESLLPQIMGPLESAVENNGTLNSLFGSASDSVDLTNVEIPVKIYIDRETLYPVQMRMEMTQFGKEVLDSLSLVKVNVDAFDAVIDYSRINETSAGKAPA